MTDARMSINLPGHPKMKRVIRSLGDSGAWHVIKLFLWVAGNRPDGDLSGMTADDIELSIDWTGTPGEFVRELLAVRFIDETDSGYCVHDWEEHNPWAAGTEMRAEKAKFNAFCKHYGRDEAARRMPEYAARIGIACTQHASSMHDPKSSNAPSPSPSPSPSVDQKPSSAAQTDAGERFAEFWAVYPRDEGKAKAKAAWAKRKLDALADKIIADVKARKLQHGQWLDGIYPHATTYINGERWNDAIIPPRNRNHGNSHATNQLSLADRAAAIHANRPREPDDWIDGTATPVHR